MAKITQTAGRNALGEIPRKYKCFTEDKIRYYRLVSKNEKN